MGLHGHECVSLESEILVWIAQSNNGNVCLRLLSQASSRIDEAREAQSDIVNNANRASAIIGRIRAMRGVEDERRILTNADQRDESASQPSVRITVQDLAGHRTGKSL